MAKPHVAVHGVAVRTADLGTSEISRIAEVGHDGRCGTFGDADLLSNFPDSHVGVERDDKERIGMVRQKRPGAHCRHDSERLVLLLFTSERCSEVFCPQLWGNLSPCLVPVRPEFAPGSHGQVGIGKPEGMTSIHADGPYYDWLTPGQQLVPQHAVTLDDGLASVYQSMCGEALALPLSAPLCLSVTGKSARLASPGLVVNLSIGQSTVATRRAIANLFYRNMRVLRPVHLGETLHTVVTIKAMSDASSKPGQPLRGKALLGITTTADGEVVLDYERCALLPVSQGGSLPGLSADVGPADSPLDLAAYADLLPRDWNADAFAITDEWSTATDGTRDHVDLAAGFARLTHNRAIVHRDATASVYGKRLVYGGHVVALAQASLTRCLPHIATVVAWHSCSHTGPAFEGDLLEFEHRLAGEHRGMNGWALHAVEITGRAVRETAIDEILRWTVIVVVRR